ICKGKDEEASDRLHRRTDCASRPAHGPRRSDHLRRAWNSLGEDKGFGSRGYSRVQFAGGYWRNRSGGDGSEGRRLIYSPTLAKTRLGWGTLGKCIGPSLRSG